jgi:hypothetical protein
VNEVHYTIAAAIIIPGVVASSIFLMPSHEEREEQRISNHLEKLEKQKETEVSGLFSKDPDEGIRLVVLQPFIVMDGVFSVHLEATGDDSRTALCTSLPIVNDAVLNELYNSSEDPAMQPPGENLKRYADAVRQQLNETFGRIVVSSVILAYADVKSFNADHMRMQTGSSKRCVTRKT